MPTRLHIHTGNQLESLSIALSRNLAATGGHHDQDPLKPEVIMVQSRGMQRWISMSIARLNGICANMEFPFPNAFLENTYTRVIGPLAAKNPFDPQYLTFRILALLKTMSGHQAFAMIKNYLSGPKQALKAYQLAARIADIFDQYLVFRPEMVREWEKGKGSDSSAHHRWQAMLWCELMKDAAIPHRADQQRELIHRLRDLTRPVKTLPTRVSVFGISHLPPFHLQVLEAVAHRIPVALYLLNPCREYWADIISDHQMIKTRRRAVNSRVRVEDLHFERGNRLLSSWGQQGRQFFGLTQQLDAGTNEWFKDNNDQTLLGRVQQDILDLIDRPTREMAEHEFKVDHSIGFHVCHSPMREVEVLHDQLLEILNRNPDISPGDILVMTPDISRYAPYIHGVFGAFSRDRELFIPYTVADQTLPEESRLVEGFLQLLKLRKSRFEASIILDLLNYAAIRHRFGLEASDLPMVEQWIREVDIRWGWSGEDRRKIGLPGFEDNTWRSGLDRLLMGYAAWSSDNRLFAEVLPHGGIEGGQAEVLGRLVHFLESLHHQIHQLPPEAPLANWKDILTGLMDAFLDGSDVFARDMQLLRNAIDHLGWIDAGSDTPIDLSLDVICAHLTDTLQRASHGTGFMAGSVTFCAMLPMRSIPAEVICILGMQYDAFPQDIQEPGFNLISMDPLPGDRSKRNDDKYLFLEALLSARRHFYISYIGRDIQDNSIIPPSVLVSELLEYLADGMGISQKDMVTVHPLQSFSAAYFDGSDDRLYSYAIDNLKACRQLVHGATARSFFEDPLPDPVSDQQHVTVSSLTAFLQHPVKYLLEHRLGIYLGYDPEVVQDRETFHPDALERYHLNQSIFDRNRVQPSDVNSKAAIRASGRLPHGTAGEVIHDQIRAEAGQFNRRLEQHLPGDPPGQWEVDVELGGCRITGRIDSLYPQSRVCYRFANIRPKDVLMLWVDHLAMQALSDDRCPDASVLIGKDGIVRLGPIREASAVLEDYLKLYTTGLQQPIPIFPRTSYAFAVQLIEKNKGAELARREALKQWQGGYNQPGECLDPYIHLCRDTTHPLSETFESLAVRLYSPLLAHLEKQSA